jgi:hypothetical protein
MSMVKTLNEKRTKWAKERSKQHGEVMQVIGAFPNIDGFDFEGGIFSLNLQSLDKTWTLTKGVKTYWSGWFTKKDADLEFIQE